MNIKKIRKAIIGQNEIMHGPYGKRFITYADYTASGRTVQFIEDYLHKIQQTYANTHTQDNYTGQKTTSYYQQAKQNILKYLGANENYAVLPSGNGVTGAICRLQRILGIYEAPKTKKVKKYLMQKVVTENGFTIYNKKINEIEQNINKYRPVVFISSYEHHSNELVWREGLCDVVKVGMTGDGLFDLNHLEYLLSLPENQDRKKIGSFSAASNVTGIKTPVYKIAELMHRYNGLAFFDFAASGPYVDINMSGGPGYFDGIYLSPHKFLGGPGSSGLLVINKKIYDTNIPPTCAGGGTVEYVGNHSHYFHKKIEDREDAGTPAILQVIKAALALELKNNVGVEKIERIEQKFLKRAIDFLGNHPNLSIIGSPDCQSKLSIISFNIKHKQAYFHHKYIARLLNDLFGIQTRAGCACAGPYGHYLLNINDETSEKYCAVISKGLNVMKPGWVRLNFHYTLDEATFYYIVNAIAFIADYAKLFLSDYIVDEQTGAWCHKHQVHEKLRLHIKNCYNSSHKNNSVVYPSKRYFYNRYLKKAYKLANKRKNERIRMQLYGCEEYQDIAWFYITPGNTVYDAITNSTIHKALYKGESCSINSTFEVELRVKG